MAEYDDLEQSAQASAPVEFYKFVGSFKTYRYTSSDRAIIFSGETYLPVAVSRSRVQAGTHEDDNNSLTLSIPFDTDVVKDYAYAQTPPKLTLEIYRQQADGDELAYVLFWTGKVRGFNVSGRTAEIQVPSIFSLALQGEVPSVYYQAPCNHVLYDPRCGVNPNDHKYEGVVQDVSPLMITLGAEPTTTDNLKGGEIVNMRNGERRLIQSNSGSQIHISYPFVDILPTDEVEMFEGCDHSFFSSGGCPKFDNRINFGGDPYIPQDNPFNGEIA